jgi:hypothetical protein
MFRRTSPERTAGSADAGPADAGTSGFVLHECTVASLPSADMVELINLDVPSTHTEDVDSQPLQESEDCTSADRRAHARPRRW